MSYSILVLSDMIEAFDREQPKPGNETTAFIKRWRSNELERKHRGPNHLQSAVRAINVDEIESIRDTKRFRDAKRNGNNRLVDCVEVT